MGQDEEGDYIVPQGADVSVQIIEVIDRGESDGDPQMNEACERLNTRGDGKPNEDEDADEEDQTEWIDHETRIDAMLKALRRVPRGEWSRTLNTMLFVACCDHNPQEPEAGMSEIAQYRLNYVNWLRGRPARRETDQGSIR